MLNNEKSILVAYINVAGFNKERAMLMLTNVREYIKTECYNNKMPSDDSMIILALPSDRTEIVLLNAKYPDYEQIKKDAEQILNNLIEKENINKLDE